LTSFGVDYAKNVVGSTGDGALVMVKFGKECPTLYQLCLNHRIQLGVCDTDDFENEGDFETTATNEGDFDESVSFYQLIVEVRKVVKYKWVLQEKIKAELGNNLELLDVKNRWNSLTDMISMFLKLFKFIKEALLELNWSYMLDFIDVDEGSPECSRASKIGN
jgi:hypothetical protein